MAEIVAGVVSTKISKLMRTITIFVDNGLDQPVTVQIKANRENTLAKSINVGSSFTVSANSQDGRTLTPDTSGWLPYLTVTLQCSTAPASGSVTIYRIRAKGEEAKVVDALAIRDTNVHDPSTDPSNIFIVEW